MNIFKERLSIVKSIVTFVFIILTAIELQWHLDKFQYHIQNSAGYPPITHFATKSYYYIYVLSVISLINLIIGIKYKANVTSDMINTILLIALSVILIFTTIGAVYHYYGLITGSAQHFSPILNY